MTAAETYADIRTTDTDTDELDYLMSRHIQLRRSYRAAAANGQAVLLASA